MKNHPKQLRKNQNYFNVPDQEVIEMKIGEGEPRVCDYCNAVLIDEQGIAVRMAYLTDFGLMCGDCIGTIESRRSYSEGKSVLNEYWYQDGKYKDVD